MRQMEAKNWRKIMLEKSDAEILRSYNYQNGKMKASFRVSEAKDCPSTIITVPN
jgi:UDP-N-acetyl-D-mannosaminuronate dehydrogenase